ncbi:MmgE/PrpD family protein [Roseateles sp. LKC17W]|uniref:MmgE/PrpD family protein n=1 Tax=Pelomonas margarita TaxID=3299031 RepID=A0ABW7FJL5_9BURK
MRTTPLAARLADFILARQHTAFDEAVTRPARRLLLNQLKASAECYLQMTHAQQLPATIAPQDGEAQSGGALAWWSGLPTTPQHAQSCNRALLDPLDFGDTHLPSLRRLTPDIVTALLAHAQAGRCSGPRLLTALAIGLEAEIACAALWPGMGVAAARCTLLGLDRAATMASLAQVVPLAMAATPAVAEALDGPDDDWHLDDIAIHCWPAPVQALAAIDATLVLRGLCAGREPQALQLTISPVAWQLAEQQAAGTGAGTALSLQHCVAASWRLGQFTVDERQPACVADAAMRGLADKVALRADTDCAGVQACSLTAWFDDGSREHVDVPAFLGTKGAPPSDSQLCELFRAAANDLVLPQRAGEVLQALWSLDLSPDVGTLLRLLRPQAATA